MFRKCLALSKHPTEGFVLCIIVFMMIASGSAFFPGSFQSSSGLQHSITLAPLTFTDHFSAPKSSDVSCASSSWPSGGVECSVLALPVRGSSSAVCPVVLRSLAGEPLLPALRHFTDLGFAPASFLGSVLARSQHLFFRKSCATSELHQLTLGKADGT